LAENGLHKSPSLAALIIVVEPFQLAPWACL